MQVNLPEVAAEVEAAFRRYEAALMANDIDTLNELFWRSAETVRYGAVEALHGYDAIVGFRRSRDVTDIARELVDTRITTFGRDTATAFTEYRRTGSGRRGRQSQTWIRMPEGWRIVAAHVSLLPDGD